MKYSVWNRMVRGGLLALPALALGLTTLLHAGSTTPVDAEITFEKYEVVTGSAARQTVLTGFLLGGAIADLAVVNIDEDGVRQLRLFTFREGAWVDGNEAVLGPAVLFVDVAAIGGRDRLITYEPGAVGWFDPKTATEHPLVAVTSSFVPPREGEVPHVDITRDVNHDGRDDLVVPASDGFLLFVQTSDGEFTDPRISSSTRPRTASIRQNPAPHAGSPWTGCPAIGNRGGCPSTSCSEGELTRAGRPERRGRARSTEHGSSGM